MVSLTETSRPIIKRRICSCCPLLTDTQGHVILEAIACRLGVAALKDDEPGVDQRSGGLDCSMIWIRMSNRPAYLNESTSMMPNAMRATASAAAVTQ